MYKPVSFCLQRTSDSPRREEPTKTSVMISPPTAPTLPVGESAYPRDARDVYPARPREDSAYSRVNKGGPGHGMEHGNTSLIHDFSEMESGRRSHGENPGVGRAKVYDFIPEGKVGIQCMQFPGSTRPLPPSLTLLELTSEISKKTKTKRNKHENKLTK